MQGFPKSWKLIPRFHLNKKLWKAGLDYICVNPVYHTVFLWSILWIEKTVIRLEEWNFDWNLREQTNSIQSIFSHSDLGTFCTAGTLLSEILIKITKTCKWSKTSYVWALLRTDLVFSWTISKCMVTTSSIIMWHCVGIIH